MVIAVGDRFPSVNVSEGTPRNLVNTGDLFAGKRVVLFGVPGAFTPGCHKTHLPGYVQDFEKYRAKGIELFCLSVNDAFVMQAWAEATGAAGKIRTLADAHGELTKALGLQILGGALGPIRCRRFSMLIEDGVVKVFHLEPESAITCSLSSNMLSSL